jgi:hypothetical protein
LVLVELEELLLRVLTVEIVFLVVLELLVGAAVPPIVQDRQVGLVADAEIPIVQVALV